MLKNKGPKPWSKLKRDIYALFSPGLKIQLHCAAYRMKSAWGSSDLPRYWITLGKEIIWDYPRDFINQPVKDWRDMVGTGRIFDEPLKAIYPYGGDIGTISCLIREYIDTPREGTAYEIV